MIKIFDRKRRPKHDEKNVINQEPVAVNPKLGLNVQYGLSIICKEKGAASLIINGLDPQLIEMIAVALKNDKRFLRLVREAFRKSNLPVK